ncbi:hypothetical protein Bca4012_009994 [Brassica carinata]
MRFRLGLDVNCGIFSSTDVILGNGRDYDDRYKEANFDNTIKEERSSEEDEKVSASDGRRRIRRRRGRDKEEAQGEKALLEAQVSCCGRGKVARQHILIPRPDELLPVQEDINGGLKNKCWCLK